MVMENVTDILSLPKSNSTTIETSPLDPEYISYYNVRLFSMVSLSITFLLGTSGNGFVIGICTFKLTKTVNVIWFLNLAIADFIFDFFLPLHIVSKAMDGYWPFGGFLCKISNMVLYLNMLASISFLVVISIDRCISVVCPFWSRKHRRPSLAWKVAFVTWMFSVIVSSPYPAFYDTVDFLEDNDTFCFVSYAVPFEDFSEKAFDIIRMRHRVMIITRLVTMFIVPFIIIIICYGLIAVKIRQRPCHRTSSRPFRIIITILVLFFICWCPFHSLPLLHFRGNLPWSHTFYLLAEALASSLAYFNSCLNPILYFFMGRDFKDMFRRSILSVFERAFNEEQTLATLDTRSPPKSSSEVESCML
ncbi:chemerin-like receptor 1 [Pleurodeles waltl]|uniref:chemerin-like receptor 1 n=1 Tax=Pleurodeles waltl TaxID=8319 RepID=UPI003709A1F2